MAASQPRPAFKGRSVPHVVALFHVASVLIGTGLLLPFSNICVTSFNRPREYRYHRDDWDDPTMATVVRQRVPFRFSEDGDLKGRILDEQEQEEVIDRLRKQNEDSNTMYYVGLQVLIGLSLLIHGVFAFSPTRLSPLTPLFPNSPSEPVPFASGLLLLQFLVHANLIVYCLPSKHYLWLKISNARLTGLPPSLSLPLPLSHPVSIILPMVAPVYSIFIGRGRVDVLWWSAAGLLTAVIALTTKWMKDTEKDVEELEQLRYRARGA